MEDLLIYLQRLYMFAIAMGITLGGLTAFVILLLGHRRSKAYDLD